MKRFLCAGVITALATLATSTIVNGQVPEKPEALDYAVYSAVVAEFCLRQGCQFVLIIDRTAKANASRLDLGETDRAELLENFSQKNSIRSSLEAGFRLLPKYQLISEEDSLEMYVSSVPIITFSRVGFNKKKDQALVFFTAHRSELSKLEQFLILSKEPTGWKVMRSVPRLLH
jgi:hypothetical protein